MVRLLSLVPLLGVAAGLGYNTECGPMDHRMFEALAVLGKTPAQMRFPGSRPYPNLPAGKSTMPEIKHFVYLMMENHSQDNILGTLKRKGLDGYPLNKDGKPDTLVPQRYTNGSIQHLYEMPSTCAGENNNPSQNWESSHQQWNNGSMDGFAAGGEQDKPYSLGYFTEDHLPVLHSLAQVFPISDRYFCSALAQTWPNRMMALGASARGIVATGQTEDLVNVKYPNGIIVNTFDKHKISWTNYFDPSTFNTFGHLFPNITSELDPKHFRKFPDDLLSDAKRGKLSQFTWIDYNGSTQSMEPPQNVVKGEELIYQVVNAIMESPNWKNTVMIINWDEHGGSYDHVPPQPAIAPDDVAPIIPSDKRNHTGYYQYDGYRRTGFRVPFYFLSPYAKKDYISHVVNDHGSPLAFLEYLWNLPALSCRDANANNLMDMLDLDAMARKKPNFPNRGSVHIAPPSRNPKYVHCTGDDPGVIPAPGSVEASNSSGPDFDPKCVF